MEPYKQGDIALPYEGSMMGPLLIIETGIVKKNKAYGIRIEYCKALHLTSGNIGLIPTDNLNSFYQPQE
jgi:hypothetical protein